MRTASLILLLLAVPSCGQQSAETGNNKDIAQYTIDSLIAKPDTVWSGDTVKVALGMFLDCTNHITHIDTVLDTTHIPRKLALSVFGTIWVGPGPRPLCPAVFTEKNVDLRLPKSGLWVIEANEPPGARMALPDTVLVR